MRGTIALREEQKIFRDFVLSALIGVHLRLIFHFCD
jgi:hypothetical protein